MAAELYNFIRNRFISAAQYLFISAFSALFLFSCATTSDYSEAEKGSTSSYTFYDYKDGDQVQYKVYFDEDEISGLYIDGKKVPDDEIHKHKNMIYDRLDNVSQGAVHRFRNNVHIDSDWLKLKMGDEGRDFKENKIRVHIDREKLHKELQRLREELKDMDVEVQFDKEQFEHEMNKLKKELRKWKDEDFKFDMEEFSKKMHEFSKKMKEQEFAMRDLKVHIPEIHIPDLPAVPDVHIPEINIPEIKVDLSDLEDSMKDLDKNMAELDKHMKKLDAFMDEWKKELVKDGIIKTEDESFELNVNKDELKINDKKVPDSLFRKYQQLYKKHFGEEFDPHFKMRING